MVILLIALTVLLAGLLLAKGLMEGYLSTQQAMREAAHQKLLKEHPLGYLEEIQQAAQENNIKPAFLAAIILCESSYRRDAESSVGARGLMQVMPDTASWIAGKLNEEGSYSFDQMYDAATNIRYGSWYISYLSQRFGGDPILVASAYHAGQNEVAGWLNDPQFSSDGQTLHINDMVDGPTKQYAQKVVSAYAIYQRLYFETQPEPGPAS
jgi:soluble lytic murein transglycosylase